jgi:hypothetical protein
MSLKRAKEKAARDDANIKKNFNANRLKQTCSLSTEK